MAGSRAPKSSGSRLTPAHEIARSRVTRSSSSSSKTKMKASARSSLTPSLSPPPPLPFFNNPPQSRMDIRFLLDQNRCIQQMQAEEQLRIQEQRASHANKCEECPKSFKTAPRRRYHEDHEHPRMGPPPFTTVPLLLRFPSNLPRSKAVHTCQICNSTFRKKGDLKKHNDSVHKKLKPHQCKHPGCFQAFHLRKDLRIHVESVPEKRRFLRSLCGNSYSRKEHVRRHAKDAHEEKKAFPCPVCPSLKFSTLQNLQVHLHTQKHKTTATRQAKNLQNGGGLGHGGGPGNSGGNNGGGGFGDGGGWRGGLGGGSSSASRRRF